MIRFCLSAAIGAVIISSAAIAQERLATLSSNPGEPLISLNHVYSVVVTPEERAAQIESMLRAASQMRKHTSTDLSVDFRMMPSPQPPQLTLRTSQRSGDTRGVVVLSNDLAALSAGDQSAAPLAPSVKFAADVDTFDLNRFEQNIIEAVEDQSIGYVYAITRNGQLVASGANGDARTPTDGQRDQAPEKEMITASMSKSITAVAMLHAMKANGVSINDSIIDYLPPDWDLGPNVENITFRRLLTHRSGLDVPGTGLGGLPDGSAIPGIQAFSCCSKNGNNHAAVKQIIENGTAPLDNTPENDLHVYTNANYSLMRYLITHMTTSQGVIDNYANVWSLGDVYGAIYAQYVQENIFSPAGIFKLGPAPFEDENNRTLLYDLDFPNDAGFVPGDWLDAVGANGWYMSAIDLARFLVYLRHTNVILDAQTREMMNDLYLGWHDPSVFSAHVNGAFGNYHGHGGTYIMDGCMINFPIKVEAVLMVNSDNGAFTVHLCNALKTAYDTAFN